MSGGGDPWLLGLTRPKWAIRGRASLPAWRYRGPWFRRFVRPIGAAIDTRHSAAWVEVTILKWRSHCSGLNWGKEGSSRLSSLVWKLD